MKAVIMAGGKGSRLSSVTNDEIPKPMTNICGKPILMHQIERLKENGITEIIMIVGHRKEKIFEYFGNGLNFGVVISYIEEDYPLGTGGALFFLKEKIKDDFLFIFGDIIFDICIERLYNFHKIKNSLATLVVHPNSHPYDSDLVILNDDSRAIAINGKNKTRDYPYHNCVNSGIYLLSHEILQNFSSAQKTDFEKEILIPLINANAGIFGYTTSEYLKDAGTPDRFYATEEDIKNGIVASKNLSKKQKCIFLDRDGTINVYCGLVVDKEQIRLIDGAAEAIRLINKSGYLAVVVTNQPVVARGLVSIDGVEEINKHLETILGEKGAYFDGLFYCPHHPDKGFEGENALYKINCDCRKPKTGLIKQSVIQFNIDTEQSFFIGDTTIDIQTAANAGLKSILVRTGEGGCDGKYNIKPDAVKDDMLQAVEYILQQ